MVAHGVSRGRRFRQSEAPRTGRNQPVAYPGVLALVTGGSKGIGRATVAALVRDGYTVVAVARGEERLTEVREATGADTLAGDLSTSEGCAKVAAAVTQRYGRVDVLVNNAGLDTNRERPVWEQTREVWDETLALNLHAPFELTRRLTGPMIEHGSGRIVMVSSTAGDVGAAKYSAYCTSKHGLLGLMRSVAADVGPHGVTCNAVMPGWVRTTEMSERTVALEAGQRGATPGEAWAEIEAEQPSGRVVTPDQVANVIAFLASDRAHGINGETVRVSAGSHW
jgi:NAD(P)-dependent dehydrogenase (short-subunit alcohol dehydrogenase family)